MEQVIILGDTSKLRHFVDLEDVWEEDAWYESLEFYDLDGVEDEVGYFDMVKIELKNAKLNDRLGLGRQDLLCKALAIRSKNRRGEWLPSRAWELKK